MNPELKRRIQLVLVFAILVAAGRAGYILYTRRSSKVEEEKKPAPPLNADYYVVPKKLYPYDLKSARQLTQQPVWVKEGYRYTYYPYNPAAPSLRFLPRSRAASAHRTPGDQGCRHRYHPGRSATSGR